MQSLFRKIFSTRKPKHEPLICVTVFLFGLFAMSELLMSAWHQMSGSNWQKEGLIWMAAVLAYFIGFARTKKPKKHAGYPASSECDKKELPEQKESDTRAFSQAQEEGTVPNRVITRCNATGRALDLFSLMLEKGDAFVHHSSDIKIDHRFFRTVAMNLDDQRLRENGLQLLQAIRAHGLAVARVVQNRLICAWKHDPPKDILDFFMKVKEEGVLLDSRAYRCIMEAQKRTDPSCTLKLYHEMVDGGIKVDRVAFNATLSACHHLRMTSEALHLFRQMSQHELVPNGKTYGILIRTCTATRQWKTAVYLFGSMLKDRIEPSRIVYYDMIHCYIKTDSLEQAVALYRSMIQAGVQPDRRCCLELFKACKVSGQTEIADRIVKGIFHGQKMDVEASEASTEFGNDVEDM